MSKQRNAIIFIIEIVAFLGCLTFATLWLIDPEKNYEPKFTLCTIIFILTEILRRYSKPTYPFVFHTLSTFSDYNMCFNLVNKSKKKVPYKIIVTTVEEAKITYGDAAEGTIDPHSTLLLRVDDVVKIAGSTKFSASVNVEANRNDINIFVTKAVLETKEISEISPSI